MHTRAQRTIRLGAAAALACAGLFALSARASELTLGSSLGYGCYEKVKFGYTDLDALQLCNRALSEAHLGRKDLAATYVNRGIIRAARGDLEGAIHDYDTALKMKPDMGEALANKGAAYLRANNFRQAISVLNKALDYTLTQPSHVYYNRAIAYESLGEHEKAYRDFQQAAKLQPDWSWPQRELQRYRFIAH